jgi:membrane protein implicated in regulation of membrane protease activity
VTCGSIRQMGAAARNAICRILTQRRKYGTRKGKRMADHWMWWALAAVLVGAELMTGTFYLLAVGVAFVAGGVAAWVGASVPVQLLIGGTLAIALTMVAHRWRMRRVLPAAAALDLGHSVRVLGWKDDGGARVDYRGTQWDAELASPGAPRAETMYIVGTRGSTLLIADRRA